MSRAMSAAELVVMVVAISASVAVMVALVFLAEHQSNNRRPHSGQKPATRPPAGNHGSGPADEPGLAAGGWAPDWPDGYGFLYYLTAGPAISSAGNTNIEEQNDPVVNSLFDKAMATADPAARNRMWAQIDRRTMQNAVILP